jgi:hypothetical protein
MDNISKVLEAFASSALLSGHVWGLKGREGWAICDSVEFEDTDVLPFFSTQEAAALLCVDEWQAYTPSSFPLEEFLEDWLPGMHEDNVMVGLQWDKTLDGPEFEPVDVAAVFKTLC